MTGLQEGAGRSWSAVAGTRGGLTEDAAGGAPVGVKHVVPRRSGHSRSSQSAGPRRPSVETGGSERGRSLIMRPVLFAHAWLLHAAAVGEGVGGFPFTFSAALFLQLLVSLELIPSERFLGRKEGRG